MNTEQEVEILVENKILKGKLEIALKMIEDIKKESKSKNNGVDMLDMFIEFCESSAYEQLFNRYNRKSIPVEVESKMFFRWCKKKGYEVD